MDATPLFPVCFFTFPGKREMGIFMHCNYISDDMRNAHVCCHVVIQYLHLLFSDYLYGNLIVDNKMSLSVSNIWFIISCCVCRHVRM